MTTFDPNTLGTKVPSAATSEEKIEVDARKALAHLKRHDAIDLHWALGLTPYLESEKECQLTMEQKL